MVVSRVLGGHVEEPYGISMAQLFAVSYMTEISLIMMLNNQFYLIYVSRIHPPYPKLVEEGD